MPLNTPVEIHHILFPLDFAEPGYAAARLVARMAARFDAQVTLLHVVPLSVPVFPDDAAEGVSLDADTLKHDLAPALDGAFRREFAHLQVDRVVDLGGVAEGIARFADTQGVDLIMMPTWGRGPFRRLLLGSTTAKVVHDVQCPVWTSAHSEQPPEAHAEQFPEAHAEQVPKKDGQDRAGRMVLCAVDQTPESSPVMEWAAQFSERVGARLHLAHVLNDSGNWTQTRPDAQWRKRLQKDALEAIEDVQRRSRVNAPATVLTGKISAGICEEARKLQAGLVVVGRGRVHDTAGRLGKHAHEILRCAPCPVISV